MNISRIIREKKEQFRNWQFGNKREKLMMHNMELRQESNRQAELVKLSQQRVILENELNKNITINQQGNPPKNNLRRLGEGLAKIMNKAKEDISEMKAQGHFKGPYGQEPTKVNIIQNSPFNESPKRLDFGGGVSPFVEFPKKK